MPLQGIRRAQELVCKLTEQNRVPSKGRKSGYLLYYCSPDVKKSKVMKTHLADAEKDTEMHLGTFLLSQCVQPLRSAGAFFSFNFCF